MMKRFLSFLIVLVSVFTLVSCSQPKMTDELFAMDTYMQMTYYGGDTEKAAKEIRELIKNTETDFGAISGTGSVARLNETGKLSDPSPELLSMLTLANELYVLTDGAYDITVLPLVKLWGFDGGEKRVPTEGEIAEALAKVGSDRITFGENEVTLGEGQKTDLGSLAKGFVSEAAISVLDGNGVEGAVLSLGGNVQTYGQKPDGSDFVIGIADPFSPETVMGTIKIKGSKAIVTSGTYQRYFEKDGVTYHHILDARTGRPSGSDLVSVTVVCESALEADGFSTALFLLGSDEASKYLESSGLDAIMVTKEGKIIITENLSESFILKDENDTLEVIGR